MSFVLRAPGPVGPPPSPPAEVLPYPRCEHPAEEVRQRRQSNGVLVAVRQCLTCGGFLGAVAKAK